LKLRDSDAKEQPCGLVLDIPSLAKPPANDAPTKDVLSWYNVRFNKPWYVIHYPYLAHFHSRNPSRSPESCLYGSSVYFPPGTPDSNAHAFAANHPSLHDLPPTLVSAAEHDIVRDSAINFAMRVMNESKNGAELHVSYFGPCAETKVFMSA